MTGFRDLRSNHDFTVLWIGQTISELGTRVSMFVFPLVTYAITGSALLAGVAGGLDLLGVALALLPGGLLADRVHRGRLMRAAAGAGVLLYASLVVAGVFFELTVPHLFAVALLTGVCAGLFVPAEMSAVRAVVPTEQLPTALSQQQARQHVASLVGGPLGGALYAVARWVPFLFDAVTFAIAWVLLGRIRTDLSPAPQAGPKRRARADIAEGWRFIWARPFFRTLTVWGMCSNLVVNAIFTAATVRLIQGGFAPWSIGLVETAAGVCGVLGALVAPRIIERTATGRLTVLVAWSFVPLLVPMILWNNPAVVMISLSAGVFLNPAGNAGISSYKMSITPPEIIGRVQATGQFLGWSTLPLAPVVGGVLLAWLGGPEAMAFLTVLCALVALIPTLSASVRSVPKPAEWSVSEATTTEPVLATA
ncbi:MAG TPA: MFS transporter [Nocardioides sp.]|uniref:MFS transporter n=1 Tax=uncultured Nocardioides sp. TaxID=198441 RepID=UPI000EEBD217|nr:MFS transporter [uncultured Nocardioides sp.]HCB05637.1 MFS transporter [Nocardioides sp.]HRD62326.1 MFS transporter [Nocardioides sp.]HRI96980.1 MFS transporter [Nocardioides sp.]HRK45431.1 MFS transporter [Nocardioides sp.]